MARFLVGTSVNIAKVVHRSASDCSVRPLPKEMHGVFGILTIE